MPSEIMDQRRLSPSSYFYEEIRFPAQRQVGFWKPESMPDHHGVGMDLMSRTSENKSVVSPSLEKLLPMEAHSMETMGLPHPSILRDQKAKLSLGQHVVGSERTTNVSMSSWRSMDHNVGSRSNSFLRPASYFVEGNKVGMNGIQYERELFSSSLSELFNRKLKLSSNGAPFGQSADALTSHYEEEEPLESLEEIEARTIGNLLPDDDDLLSGAFDEFEYVAQPNNGDDIEDFDLFSSGGGMELEGDDVGQKGSDVAGGISNSQQGGSIVGEHPYGEHPSRTLFVRNINSNVEDSELKVLFEQYGDIRALYTACKHRGFVMISYYDIRAARNAMRALQNKPLRRRKLDIHYSIPKDNPSDRDINQGTLVVFNLDSSVSNDDLRQIFGVYGEIKEIRETPHKHHHKFIEFYDVRAADAALRALNRTDIAGKRIKLEPSRPGGSRRSMIQQPSQELDQEEAGAYQQWGSPADNSGSFGGSHSGVTEPSTSMSQINFGLPCIPTFHPHSLPEFHDGLVNGIPYNSSGPIAAMAGNMSSGSSEVLDNRHIRIVGVNGYSIEPNEGAFSSSGNGSFPHHGHHYVWSNSNPYHPHSPSPMMLSNSPLINGVHSHPTPQLHGLPIAPSHVMSTVLPISHHHVGSAPAINPSIWDRRHSYAGESPEASGLYPGSFGGGMGLPSMSTLHPLGFTSHNIFPHIGGNSMDPLISSTNIGMHSPQQRCHMFQGMPTSFDAPNERVRSRRNEAGSSQIDNKKQFELDIDRILSGEETRTTLMIKNIPNKYTSKMLLAAIDERHKGTYDFIYLPIDFKNKCNVGYAFINMIDPQQIVPFYQAFNGKKWEKFNSEKVASLAYGRIQGKAALIAHFQNSSLMNEDKRCRPILFHSDGPNAGDQEPFPMAMNIRSRASKSSSSGNEENNQGSPSTSAKGDESSKGMELSSGYVKDSE